MRVAALMEPGRFETRDEPVPEIASDELLVRVAACGVCASELDMFRGLDGHARYPWYPGHEVSGTVEKVGDQVQAVSVGDRVAVWVTARGYADAVAVKAAHTFPVDDVPLDLALAEPLACAANAVELAAPSLGDDVVVIGAGFMGHLIHKLVSLRGPRQVIVADTRDEALRRAEMFGASRTVNVARESLPDVVREFTEGRGADVAFEITGVQAALDLLGEVTRMSGAVVIAGYHQGPSRTVKLGEWNWMAFRIVNAHFRDVGSILRGMRIASRLMVTGRISLEGLVTHRFPIEEIEAAFRTAVEKPTGFVKATVTP
jgi:L-iditol 2-dehydrogenase